MCTESINQVNRAKIIRGTSEQMLVELNRTCNVGGGGGHVHILLLCSVRVIVTSWSHSFVNWGDGRIYHCFKGCLELL